MGSFYSPGMQFVIYLVFSNLGLSVHYYFIHRFFEECQQNKYAIDLQKVEQLPGTSEAIELTENLTIGKKDQDYNLKRDKSTLTIFQNLRKAFVLYLFVFYNFFIFILSWPILIFQIDISRVVPIEYKYVVHTVIINIAALFGHSLYMKLRIDKRIFVYLFVLFKTVFIVIIYFIREGQILEHALSDSGKMLFLLVFYFYNMYGMAMMVDCGQKFYKNKPYDRLKFGEINQYMIQIAGFFGSMAASLIK